METEEEQDMSIVRRVVEVNLNCDSCEFSTFWSRSIGNHRMVHTAGDEKLYECEHCNFSTRYRYNLRRHVKKIHFDLDAVMKIANSKFLSQRIISTPEPCTQSSERPRDTINCTGTANNAENERSSSYINKSSINFQNGISSSAVPSSNYQDEISSSVVSKNSQTGTSSNFVSNTCESVISSSIASNNYQKTSSSFVINNDNNFQNENSSSFINKNNCVNEVTSSTFRNNFQNGISSISATSNNENVIRSSAVSSNYQNTRRNRDSFVSSMPTLSTNNNVENFDTTLSTKSLSRPKPPSVENELMMNLENNIIVFVCELCGFECLSADVCYNHAAEHQNNEFSPSWLAACADVL